MKNVDELKELCIKFSDSKRQATILYNGLRRGSMLFNNVPPINTVNDLINTPIDDIRKIRNIGESSIIIVEKILSNIDKNDYDVSTKQIMTPEHELWQEFIERLSGPEGCDFKEDSEHGITWLCGGAENSYAIDILNTMDNIDIAGSIAYFEEHGGYCDCEIVFNVVKREQ